jgi:predicted AlkP superfamily phosphohydrolase/phosphomutase
LIAFSEIGFGPLRNYISVNEILREHRFLGWKQAGTEVDWTATLAAESVQGSSGVNINLKSRHLDGTVDTDSYESLRADVATCLGETINPHTGLKLFGAVIPREELYEGPGMDGAPDLILIPADERYLPQGDPSWSLHVKRPLQSGWHRKDSYWAMAGAEAPADGQLGSATLSQILPAIERATGVDASTEESAPFERREVASGVH